MAKVGRIAGQPFLLALALAGASMGAGTAAAQAASGAAQEGLPRPGQGPAAMASPIPAGVTRSFVRLAGGVPGMLYEPRHKDARAATAVFVMHANGDYLQFSPCTELARRGFRVLCANNSTNKAQAFDEGMMDDILLQVGLGVSHLRSLPGVRSVVLFGHSGGGNVMSAYQMVAEAGVASCQQPQRLSRCPDKLAGLPKADGIILADANWGQGGMTLLSLDPAILDETNAQVRDPALDHANPANGYVASGSRYSDEFIRLYQKAQGERMNRLIANAQARLAVIEAGKGQFTDDEPFFVPGAVFLGPYNKLFPQDIRLMAHTQEAWPLIHRDGSITTEVIHSVRPARGAGARPGAMNSGALRTTVRNFLSTYAVRTTPDYGYDAQAMRGIDETSSYAFTPGNMGYIHVPLLTVGMTGSYEFLVAESIFRKAASKDKSIAFIEGASHNFDTCTACETTPGQYGDTTRTLFDHVAAWLARKGRF